MVCATFHSGNNLFRPAVCEDRLAGAWKPGGCLVCSMHACDTSHVFSILSHSKPVAQPSISSPLALWTLVYCQSCSDVTLTQTDPRPGAELHKALVINTGG
jgi:hypothetical protein